MLLDWVTGNLGQVTCLVTCLPKLKQTSARLGEFLRVNKDSMDRWDDRDDLEGKVKGPQGQIARLGMGGFVKADSSKLLRSIHTLCSLCSLLMVPETATFGHICMGRSMSHTIIKSVPVGMDHAFATGCCKQAVQSSGTTRASGYLDHQRSC